MDRIYGGMESRSGQRANPGPEDYVKREPKKNDWNCMANNSIPQHILPPAPPASRIKYELVEYKPKVPAARINDRPEMLGELCRNNALPFCSRNLDPISCEYVEHGGNKRRLDTAISFSSVEDIMGPPEPVPPSEVIRARKLRKMETAAQSAETTSDAEPTQILPTDLPVARNHHPRYFDKPFESNSSANQSVGFLKEENVPIHSRPKSPSLLDGLESPPGWNVDLDPPAQVNRVTAIETICPEPNVSGRQDTHLLSKKTTDRFVPNPLYLRKPLESPAPENLTVQLKGVLNRSPCKSPSLLDEQPSWGWNLNHPEEIATEVEDAGAPPEPATTVKIEDAQLKKRSVRGMSGSVTGYQKDYFPMDRPEITEPLFAQQPESIQPLVLFPFVSEYANEKLDFSTKHVSYSPTTGPAQVGGSEGSNLLPVNEVIQGQTDHSKYSTVSP